MLETFLPLRSARGWGYFSHMKLICMAIPLLWLVGCASDNPPPATGGGGQGGSSTMGRGGQGGGNNDGSANGGGGGTGSGGSSGGVGGGAGGAGSTSCPASLPTAGNPCTGDLFCSYGDAPRPQCRDRASCTNGAWVLAKS